MAASLKKKTTTTKTPTKNGHTRKKKKKKKTRQQWRIPDIAGNVEEKEEEETATLVATLPSAWSYRVSARTGCPCVSLQCLGEIPNFHNVYFSAAVPAPNCLTGSAPEIHLVRCRHEEQARNNSDDRGS